MPVEVVQLGAILVVDRDPGSVPVDELVRDDDLGDRASECDEPLLAWNPAGALSSLHAVDYGEIARVLGVEIGTASATLHAAGV